LPRRVLFAHEESVPRVDALGEPMRSVNGRRSSTTPNRLLCLLAGGFLSFAGASAACAANGSVSYTYDALGRVSTVSYDTGVIVIYSYDANGNRTQQVINVNTTALTWSATSTPCTSNCWGGGLW
jgi:YD repeat-containing protein